MAYSNEASALIEMLQDRPVAYHPALARAVGGVKEAIFLGQLLYWHGKGARRDGWIWKTQAELEDETALSRTEQETCRRKLGELGLVEERLMGMPAKLHYRLHVSLIAETLQSSLQESRRQGCDNPADKIAENQQSITEITPEITQENTSEIPGGETSPQIPSPANLTVKQIRALELTDEQWEIMRELEAAGKARTTALEHIGRQLNKAPPAVQVYNRVTCHWPESALWDDIAAKVGDKPDNLELWESVVKGYLLKGWNKTNIATMLEFYERREIPGEGGKNGARKIVIPQIGVPEISPGRW